MPSATSSAIEPVGITSIGTRTSSPSRMTEPLPNCRSIWASAVSSAFSRSCGAGIVSTFVVAGRGRMSVVVSRRTLGGPSDNRPRRPVTCGR